MNSAAIIGGGITGLTAAFRLHQRGIPVTLYEAGPRIGGVIQTVREDGYLAECGPNTLLDTSPSIGSLISDLGIEGRRLYSDPEASNRYLVRRRQLVFLPCSVWGFLTTPLFSLSAKLRLCREPFIRRCPAEKEESLADFVVRRMGREFLDYAINPLVGGVYAGDPARLSVQRAFPKLYETEQRYGSLIRGQFLGARERKRSGEVSKQNAKKISFDKGLQVLTDTLGERLGEGLRQDTPIKRIRKTTKGWELTCAGPEGDSVERHSSVLLAMPAHKLADLQLETGNAADLSPLAEINYPPVASLVLGFRRESVSHPLNGFGVLIPQVEGFNILGAIFSSSLFPDRAPPGHVTVTCYLGGTRTPEHALLSQDKQVELALADLRTLLGVTDTPVYEHCFRHPRAIPQYELGYGRHLDLMSRVEKGNPGLFIAGHCRDGISLADSLVSGENAAERMQTFLNSNNAIDESRMDTNGHE